MTSQHVSNNDIELGNPHSTSRLGQGIPRGIPSLACQVLKKLIYLLRCLERGAEANGGQRRVTSLFRQVEDYRPGYPRFSALQASHKSFHIFRRFDNLRIRSLLLKQDKSSILEKKLNKIDHDEPSPLFLASSRLDRSTERAALLAEIDDALASYDELLERSQRILSFDRPLAAHVLSLENWLQGNACIAREEGRFLDHKDDLLTVALLEDGVIYWLEMAVTASVEFFIKKNQQKNSDDSKVHVLDQSFTDKAARVLLTTLVTLLILVPVMICNAMNDSTSRITILVLAAISFITALSLLTRSKAIDLASASAT